LSGALQPRVGETREQLGIARVLNEVLECEAGGARCVAVDGECGDLDELAVSSGGRSGLLLGAGDVAGGGGVVAAVGRENGEEGVFDGEVGHAASVRWGADSGLILR
jgi:hypothetical protein